MIRGHVSNGVVRLDPSSKLPEGAEVRVEWVEASQRRSAIELIDEWLQDESGYDEEAWPQVKADLDEHRLLRGKYYLMPGRSA
jgi:hypothetical protein